MTLHTLRTLTALVVLAAAATYVTAGPQDSTAPGSVKTKHQMMFEGYAVVDSLMREWVARQTF